MPTLADTATWIAVGFATGAAVLALAASLVLLLLMLRRSRATATAAPAGAEPAPDEIEDALEDARAETLRSPRLSEIATTIDLDTVLERTLAAAGSADGVDAAMAVVRQTEDTPLVATLGMTAEEAARQPVSSSPSGGARAVRISYRYDGTDPPALEPGSDRIRGGLAVPLREPHVGTIGTLAVFWRGGDRVPEDDDIAELEALAQTSAPAIRNAQEFREARQLADIDALTGVHNRRYFHETLERECARAHRYERGVALSTGTSRIADASELGVDVVDLEVDHDALLALARRIEPAARLALEHVVLGRAFLALRVVLELPAGDAAPELHRPLGVLGGDLDVHDLALHPPPLVVPRSSH